MAIFPQGLTHIDKRCANAGERSTLHQFKRCLSDDYMVWHDVPVVTCPLAWHDAAGVLAR